MRAFQAWKVKTLWQKVIYKRNLCECNPSGKRGPSKKDILFSEGKRELPLCLWPCLNIDGVYGLKRLPVPTPLMSRASDDH